MVFSYQAVIAVPFGRLGLLEGEAGVMRIDFLPPGEELRAPATPALRAAASALQMWCAHPARAPEFPHVLQGSAFQQRVWRAMCAIPRGHTKTYGELAASLGSSPRAVGQACGANPLPIVVPCHRVVGSRGLGGFMRGQSNFPLTVKRWLLAHERSAD